MHFVCYSILYSENQSKYPGSGFIYVLYYLSFKQRKNSKQVNQVIVFLMTKDRKAYIFP